MISIRVVDVNFYMHCPIRDLDAFYSEFRCTEVRQVPIIEIFGSTPTGQKCCLHVHGVFPYIYIPYDGLEPSDIQAYKIAGELDKSINITLGQGNAGTAHIHNIKLVSGIPAYGYHEKHHQFFRIYFYNPNIQKIACSLLEHGAIFGKSYQPHEAHINFILQFMIDFNLHGMSYINLQSAKYRDNPTNPIFREVIPADEILPASVVRRSVCAIEMDTNAINILNQDGSALIVNPGLAALWEDEECRRRDQQMETQISYSLTQERPNIKNTSTHEMFSKKLEEMMLVMKSNTSSLNLNHSVYPAESPDDLSERDTTDNSTMLNSSLNTSPAQKSPEHSIFNAPLQNPLLSAAQRNATLNTPLSQFLINYVTQAQNSTLNSPIVQQNTQSDRNSTKSPTSKVSEDDLETLLEDPRPIENDSILSQQVIVLDSDDDDDEIQILNTPLEVEDNWHDSFWDENCQVPQLDGIHDINSDEFSSHEDEWEDVNIGDLPQQTTIFDRSVFNTICNTKYNERRKANDVFICNRKNKVIPAEKLLQPGVNKLITSEPSNQKNSKIKIISDISVTNLITNNNGVVSLNKFDSQKIQVTLNSLNDAVSSLSITENDDWFTKNSSYTELELYENNYFDDVILNDVNLADAQGSSFELYNTIDEFTTEADHNKENIEYKPKMKRTCANSECKTSAYNLRSSVYSDKTTYNQGRRRNMRVCCGFCSCAQTKNGEQEYTFLSEDESQSSDEFPVKLTDSIECNNNETVSNQVEKTCSKMKPDCSPITLVKSPSSKYTVKNSQMKHWNLDGQGDSSTESNEDESVTPRTNMKKVTRKKRTKPKVKQDKTNETRQKNTKNAKNLVIQLTKILNDSPDKENTVKAIKKYVANQNKSSKVSPDNASKSNRTLRKSTDTSTTLPKNVEKVKQNRTDETNIDEQPIPTTLPKLTKKIKQNRTDKTNIDEQPIPTTSPKNVRKTKQNRTDQTNIVEQPIPTTSPKNVRKTKQNRTDKTNIVEQPIPTTSPKNVRKTKQNRTDQTNIVEQPIPTTSPKNVRKIKQNRTDQTNIVEQPIPTTSPKNVRKIKQNRTDQTNIVEQPIPTTSPKNVRKIKQNRTDQTNIVEQPISTSLPKVTKKIKQIKIDKTNLKEQPIPTTLAKVTKKVNQNRTDKANIDEQPIPTNSKISPKKSKNNPQIEVPRKSSKQSANFVTKKFSSRIYKELEIKRTTRGQKSISKPPENNDSNYTDVLSISSETTTNKRQTKPGRRSETSKVNQIINYRDKLISRRRKSVDKSSTAKKRPNSSEMIRPQKLAKTEGNSDIKTTYKSKNRLLSNLPTNAITESKSKVSPKLNETINKICTHSLNGTLDKVNETPKTNETSKRIEAKNKKTITSPTRTIQINDHDKIVTRCDTRQSSTDSESPLSKLITNQNKTNNTSSVSPKKNITQDVSFTLNALINKLTGDQTKTEPNQLPDKQKDDLKAPEQLVIASTNVLDTPKWQLPNNPLQTDSYISELSKIQLPHCRIVLTPIQFPSTWTTRLPISSKTDQNTSKQKQLETEPTSCKPNKQPTDSNSLHTLFELNQNPLELNSKNNSSTDTKSSRSQTKDSLDKLSENVLITSKIKPSDSEIKPIPLKIVTLNPVQDQQVISDSSEDTNILTLNTFDSNNTKTIENDVIPSEKNYKNALGDTSKLQETENPVERSETKLISPKVIRKSSENTIVLPESPKSYNTIDHFHITPNRNSSAIETEIDARITRSHNRKSIHMYKINAPKMIISSTSSSANAVKSSPRIERNNISPPKYSPLKVIVRSPRLKSATPLAEFEPLKKRLRSSSYSVDNNKTPARSLSKLVRTRIIPTEPKSYRDKGAGELQAFLPLHKTVGDDVPVICDTPPNQMKSIITNTAIRKRLFDSDQNETIIEETKICSYSSNNKDKTVNESNSDIDGLKLREVNTKFYIDDKICAPVHDPSTLTQKEENFINNVDTEFSRELSPKLIKDKQKLNTPNDIKASVRKSKLNGLILNDFPVYPLRKTLSQQFDCALFDTSINFTKMNNLTIAEQYDLKQGFAPRAGSSSYKMESECSETDSRTFLDGTSLIKSSKKENIYTSSDSDTPKKIEYLKPDDIEKSLVDRSNTTELSTELNLDSGKSSCNDSFPPNRPNNDIQLNCVQISNFSYIISLNEHDLALMKPSETKTDEDIQNVSSDLNETFANETLFDNSAFVSDFTLVEEQTANLEEVISQEDINEIKSALEQSILEDEEEFAASQKHSLVDTSTNNCKQIILAPKYLPPTYQDVKSKLHLYDIPKHRYQNPFYSNYADVSARIDVGSNILKISSNTIADLEEFITSSGFCGLNTWRHNKINELYPHLDTSKINLRVFFAGNSELIMEPAMFPPSRKSALNWVRTKMEQQVQKIEKKLEKSRIHVPMSPGNNNDDLNDTLTLTPCTPPEQKLAELTDGTPTTSQIGSPTLLRREKGTRTRNLQRKVLFNAQKLNQSTSSEDQTQKLSTASTLQTLSDSSPKIMAQKLSESSTLNNSCQITGVALNNTHDFKMSYENLQHARAVTEAQNLTILVLELYIRTRAELYPDPQHDEIRAIFYSINNDVPADAELPRTETGVLVVDSLTGSPQTKQQPLLEGTGVQCVITYVQSEVELIDALVKLIRKWDPDIFAGYEIEMLSWGYLIERSSVIGINLTPQLSRLNPELIKPKTQQNNTQRYELKLRGRIVLDIWRLLKHEIAVQSYTFENMMYHVLHHRVPEHSFKDLTYWWEYKTNFFRHNTAKYYITRVEGVLKLLDQLDLINRTCELARLFGIQFYEVLSRGSQFRVESMMLRLTKPQNYITTSPSVQQRAKMRAPEYVPLIFEPESRFYTDPVIVLDFQSLYPSIIIAYNYCYSTCIGRVSNLGSDQPFEFGAAQLKVPRSTIRKLDGKINFSPCGVGFVNSDIRKGILPRMLKEILETRLMVKASMKENKDNKLLQRVLHSRQLGLKLIANVTYGYTAANYSGRMPCVEVADSVVSKGRETLERAVKLIEKTPKWGAKVVYGDTDSLFVLVEGRNRKDAFKIGAEIAEAVTQDNPPPVKLKLEKIYQPCILQTKKRYVGYMFETPTQTEPEYNAKGIETVRRDGCPAVAKMLERSLQILFDTQDVSLVKRYVVRQFNKLLTGRASIQDLIFAREYRGSSGYRPGACVPALELSKRWSSVDKRREPRQGQRVPYIIVNGPPGQPLIRLVRCPRELLADPARLRPNAVYYITRVIAPPLNRCLSLIGADVHSWYSEMPRKHLLSLPTEIHHEMRKKSTISQYFATSSCAVCGDQTRNNLCERCATNSQQSVVVLQSKINDWERSNDDVYKICQSCCSRNEFIDCTSLDCPILYRKKQIERDLQQVPFIRNLLSKF